MDNDMKAPRICGSLILLHGAGLLVLAVILFQPWLQGVGVTVTLLNALKSVGVFAAGALVFAGLRAGVWVYVASSIIHITQLVLQYSPDTSKISRLSIVFVVVCGVLFLPSIWSRLR